MQVTPEMRAKLPEDMKDTLASQEFLDMCVEGFDKMDVGNHGFLRVEDMAPGMLGLISSLQSVAETNPSLHFFLHSPIHPFRTRQRARRNANKGTTV